MKISVWTLAFIIYITLAVVSISLLIMGNDNIDVDNLAKMMCKSYNLTVDHVEHNQIGLGTPIMPDSKLKIYCKKEEVKPLEDGYLLVIGDGEKWKNKDLKK